MKASWRIAVPGLASLAALLAGCESAPPAPEPKPMIPAVVAGMNVPPDDVENVRYGESVRQYRCGRYIDPNNTRIMYERNVLYKVEEDPAWNLRPNAGPLRTPEPWSPDKPPRALDSQRPLYAEMEAQVMELRRIGSDSGRALAAAQAAAASSAEARAAAKSQAATMSAAVNALGTVGDGVRSMERRLSELDARTKALEAARRLDAAKGQGGANMPDPDAPAPDEGVAFKPQIEERRPAK